MRQRTIILGAGEYGTNISDICRALGYDVVGFLDDSKPEGEEVLGFPVLGVFSDAWKRDYPDDIGFFVAIGDPEVRTELSKQIIAAGRSIPTIVHPTSIVSAAASLGCGVYIGPFCVVLANALIGDYVHIMTHTTVGGSAVIEDGAFIGPSCDFLAHSRVGATSFLGAKVIILVGRTVGSRCHIGAGAVVTRDIADNSTAVGMPAKVIQPRGEC